MRRDSKFIVLLAILMVFVSGCSKIDNWLDEKYNKSDITPTKVRDFQKLLDNDGIMNYQVPVVGAIGSDNYYLQFGNWQNLSVVERNSYVWAKDIFEGGSSSFDWTLGYQTIEYANVVIDGLKNIDPNTSNKVEYNNALGSALFFRAFTLFNLSQIFSKAYDAGSSNSDLGIPLKLTQDVNEKIVRPSVTAVYDQITKDLQSAVELLPETPLSVTRPCSVAANALLAKVMLYRENYADAVIYATAALSVKDSLNDFSVLNPLNDYPFPFFYQHNLNPEIIFYATGLSYMTLDASPAFGIANVDTILLELYEDDDLRKSIYFQNVASESGSKTFFKGTYTGNFVTFSGIATNEVFLVRAESYARLGKVADAMKDLNDLLKTRWKKNFDGSSLYQERTASSVDQALNIILKERRKELPFTGQVRWEDLRRLNKDERFTKTLIRELNESTYTLPPNDDRYVYPIPEDEIKMSGIPQNIR